MLTKKRKTTVKSEEQTEVQNEVQNEVQSEVMSEVKSEVQGEVKSELQGEVKSEPSSGDVKRPTQNSTDSKKRSYQNWTHGNDRSKLEYIESCASSYPLRSSQFELIDEIENLSEEPPAIYAEHYYKVNWQIMRTSPLLTEKKRRSLMYDYTYYLRRVKELAERQARENEKRMDFIDSLRNQKLAEIAKDERQRIKEKVENSGPKANNK